MRTLLCQVNMILSISTWQDDQRDVGKDITSKFCIFHLVKLSTSKNEGIIYLCENLLSVLNDYVSEYENVLLITA